jgi:hypothetical protein
MKEKLQWLWDNIMSIYIDKGLDYRSKVDSLLIISNDNYFECVVESDYNFKISIEYSFNGEPKIYFEPYNTYNDIDFYIDKLKPIFREYKINDIL